MRFVVFVANQGVPAEALADKPEITVRRADTGAAIVTDVASVEIGSGWYGYDFTLYDETLDYVALWDADPNDLGQVSAFDRYYSAATEGPVVTANRKLLNNRLELQPGSINNWELWDDDDVTVIRTFDVTDKTGAAITVDSGVPARRTRGT